MSRHGYSSECDNIELYRGNVDRSLKGKRGQRALADLVKALDAMPEKALGANAFTAGACHCPLAVLADHRGVDVSDLDGVEDDFGSGGYVAPRLNIAGCMAAEVMFINDADGPPRETPGERWVRVRRWAAGKLNGASRAVAEERGPA